MTLQCKRVSENLSVKEHLKYICKEQFKIEYKRTTVNLQFKPRFTIGIKAHLENINIKELV